MRNTLYHWGVDLGGTKVECAVLDENAKPIIRKRIATEAKLGYEHVISRIALLIDTIKQETQLTPTQIGFSTPGALDYETKRMKFSNSTVLNEMPLKASLEEALGVPCTIENDANCFGYAEVKLGVIKNDFPDARCVFAVIMGTGVGGSLLFNGEIVNGPHQMTGEWGHNVLIPNGPPCYCGKHGCVETYISGTALQKYYHSLTGQHITLQTIIERAKQDEAAAQDTLQHLYKHYGLAMGKMINMIDPDVIVIGGGLSNIPSLFTEGRQAILTELFASTLKTPIVAPMLGDSAGVFGAALLQPTAA